MIDFEAVVASVDASGFPIRLQLGVFPRDGGLELRATMIDVPDRETRKPTTIYFVEMVSSYGLRHFTEDSFAEYLWRFARGAIAHELAEHFLIGGVRKFDPHRLDRPRADVVTQPEATR